MAQSDTQAPIAAGYPEAERQAAELAALKRMLDASRGCFSLSVAVCNSPALRDFLIGEARALFPGIRVVTVPKGHVDVFGFVTGQVDASACAALFVVNLEASIDSAREDQPTLRSLNASRELWQRFACPVVFWLPEYAATLTARHAPDFWRYRSHRFEFVSEQAGATAAMAERFSDDTIAAANLSAAEKRFRIAELEARLADAGESPPKPLEGHRAVWLSELGFLYLFLGDMEKAEQTYRKALEANEKLGRLEGMSGEYSNLGVVYLTWGDVDQAEQKFRKALEIDEKLGRLEGVANAYGNLGLVYYARRELDGAEQMHRKALEIEGNLARLEGMSSEYSNLGSVYLARGDIDGAEETLQKAIEIDEKLGRLEGMASEYGNLGPVYRRRGDLDQAEHMLHKALEISEKLGHLEVSAITYANLGAIAEQRRKISLARSLWTQARDLFERIGNANWREQVQRWLEGLPPEDKA